MKRVSYLLPRTASCGRISRIDFTDFTINPIIETVKSIP
jgi:hypothetical protein